MEIFGRAGRLRHGRAVVNNRRRLKQAKGKALQRRRSEVVERTFAHICETGGARRSWLRGLVDVSKRYLMAAAAHHLGRLMRLLTGIGKPKGLQGEGNLAALARFLMARLKSSGPPTHCPGATEFNTVGSPPDRAGNPAKINGLLNIPRVSP